MNILITGSTGFIGRSLIQKLSLDNRNSLYFTDKIFEAIFPKYPKHIDWVIHLASAHRNFDPKNIYNQNILINKKLALLLIKHNLESNILFTSSIQEDTNSYYGKSKKAGGLFFDDLTKKWGKEFIKLKLPNVFGPYAVPYHTSVVATFCQNIVSGKESTINNAEVELVYIQEVVLKILNFKNDVSFERTKIPIDKLHDKIEFLQRGIKTNRIELNSKFELQLLTTLMSYN